jgi:hypothetical protein
VPPDPPERSPWWVIHLPVEVAGLAEARALADQVTRLAAWAHPEIVAGGVTVSWRDETSTPCRVYCDRRVSGSDRRCGLLAGHSDPCGPRS